MATRYVRSGGDTGVMTGTYATLTAAIAAGVAGDTYLIANDHVETAGVATTYAFNGTLTAPDFVGCIVPATGAASSGAALKTNASAANIVFTGSFVMDGVNVTVSDGVTSGITNISFTAVNALQRIRNATLTLPSVNGSRPKVSGLGGKVRFEQNVTVTAGNANSVIDVTTDLIWRDSTPYTNVMGQLTTNTQSSGHVRFEGCDLSNQTGKPIRLSAASINYLVELWNCKLNSSYTIGTLSSPGDSVRIVNCSVASGKVINRLATYWGDVSLDATVYRSTGASDESDSYSVKMTGNANTLQATPLESMELAFNVLAADVGVAKTATIYLQADAAATLSATEFWGFVFYLGDSGSLKVSRAPSLAAGVTSVGASVASDASSTWTGGTTPTKYMLTVNFTPAKAGMHYARVALAKNATVYVDPKVVLS